MSIWCVSFCPQRPGVFSALVSSASLRPQLPGVISFLVSSASWCLQRPGVFSILTSSASWCHQLPGVISILVSSAPWCLQRPYVLSFLVSSASWCLQLPGVFSFLVSSASWCLQHPGVFSILASSASWCLQLPGVFRILVSSAPCCPLHPCASDDMSSSVSFLLLWYIDFDVLNMFHLFTFIICYTLCTNTRGLEHRGTVVPLTVGVEPPASLCSRGTVSSIPAAGPAEAAVGTGDPLMTHISTLKALHVSLACIDHVEPSSCLTRNEAERDLKEPPPSPLFSLYSSNNDSLTEKPVNFQNIFSLLSRVAGLQLIG